MCGQKIFFSIKMDLKITLKKKTYVLWHFYEDTSIFGSTIEEHYELLTFYWTKDNQLYIKKNIYIIVSTCKKA